MDSRKLTKAMDLAARWLGGGVQHATVMQEGGRWWGIVVVDGAAGKPTADEALQELARNLAGSLRSEAKRALALAARLERLAGDNGGRRG